MKFKGFIFIIYLTLLLASVAEAVELRPLYRGFRSTAMGGAYVGLADDFETLFLNPAGLSNFDRPSIHYGTSDIEVSTDSVFGYSDTLAAFSDFNVGNLNALMGKNSYGRAQIAPVLTSKNFGVAILVDGQGAVYAKNQALPNITLGYQTTNGIQVGYSFSLGKRRRRQRVGSGQLSIGLAAKVLFRRGGYRTMSPLELMNLTTTGTGTALLGQIAGEWGFGLGADIGVHYRVPVNRSLTIGVGSAYTDIGNTSFSVDAGAKGPDPQKQNWTFGVSGTWKSRTATFRLLYDYGPILESTDWRQKNHIGFEIDLPLIDLYGGLNQVYLTYGASFDVWIFKIAALSYAVELGTNVRQDPDRRYLLRIDMNFSL